MSRVFVPPIYFKYICPSETPKNSMYQCLNCPLKVDINGKPTELYSCSDKSRANLKLHLNSKHSSELLKAFVDACKRQPLKRKREDDVDEASNVGGNESSVSSVQLSIEEGFSNTNKVRKLTYTQKDFEYSVSNYIFGSVLPLSHVETESFKELMQETAPGFIVPSRYKVTAQLAQRFEDGKQALISMLSKVEHVCTTADLWTARGGRSFLGVICHWWTKSLERVSVCLAVRRVTGRHTYDVLARMLHSIYAEFQLVGKIVVTVTDSGSNFLKAFKVFSPELETEIDDEELMEVRDLLKETEEKEDEDTILEEIIKTLDDSGIHNNEVEEDEQIVLPPHRRCACHLLYLICTKDVRTSFKNKSFRKLYQCTLGKLQIMFNKQSRSPFFSGKVKEHLGVLLVIPNATRWNALFDAVRHVKQLVDCDDSTDSDKMKKDAKGKENLNLLCGIEKIPKFKPVEFKFISEFVAIMTPLAFALDILQGDQGNNSTAGNLLPTIVIIKRSLLELKCSGQIKHSIPMIDSLLTAISVRFAGFFSSTDLQLASAVHPRFKLDWLDETDPEEKSLKEAITIKLQKQLVKLLPESTSAAKIMTPDDPKDFYASLKRKQPSSIADPIKNEITRFFEDRNSDNLHVLHAYPLIKELFVRYNTSLPASAAVERVFHWGEEFYLHIERD